VGIFKFRMVYLKTREKCSIRGIPCVVGIAHSEGQNEQNGIPRKKSFLKVIPVFFFVLEWFGRRFLSLIHLERNSASVANSLEWNSECVI
jgi:hypothetical protein